MRGAEYNDCDYLAIKLCVRRNFFIPIWEGVKKYAPDFYVADRIERRRTVGSEGSDAKGFSAGVKCVVWTRAYCIVALRPALRDRAQRIFVLLAHPIDHVAGGHRLSGASSQGIASPALFALLPRADALGISYAVAPRLLFGYVMQIT